MKRFLTAILLLAALTGVRAQENASKGVPDDVYYLMPSFGQGMVYLRRQGPAQGKLNICAVDNTLRFIDDKGQEMAAAANDDIVKVTIDTVTFIRYQNAFVRLHPVTDGAGVAVKREVRIIRDAKQSAYGGTSQTSSIKEYGTLYSDGVAFELNTNRQYPYRLSEEFFIYNGDSILPPTKNSLKKLFPEKKDEVEDWFKAHHTFPENLEEARALLARWAQ